MLFTVPALQSARVFMRTLRIADGEAFVRGVRRSRTLHGEWVQPVSDRASFEAMLARTGERFVPMGVFLRADHALCGVINFNQIVLGAFCSAYLGYFAFSPHEKQGLMSEGLVLALHVAFEHLGLHRLEANIQPQNAASLALVRKAGFACEGFSPGYLFIAGAWRDHERWALRRELWQPRTAPELVAAR